MLRVWPAGGDLAFDFPSSLNEEFKLRVPREKRRWDDQRRVWLVTPDQGPILVALVRDNFGMTLTLPRLVKPTEQTRLIELIYLATVKDRGADAEPSAFGWVDNDWGVVVNESVLRDWFGVPKERKPKEPERMEPETFYALLALKASASSDEVRSAYRRMVKLWHPDVCKETDATARFRSIQSAYEILGDPLKRKKYDFGLTLEAESRVRMGTRPFGYSSFVKADAVYRAPLRSGYILARGVSELRMFRILEVLAWEDIVDHEGCMLVSSFPFGAKSPRLEWR